MTEQKGSCGCGCTPINKPEPKNSCGCGCVPSGQKEGKATETGTPQTEEKKTSEKS